MALMFLALIWPNADGMRDRGCHESPGGESTYNATEDVFFIDSARDASPVEFPSHDGGGILSTRFCILVVARRERKGGRKRALGVRLGSREEEPRASIDDEE